MIAFPFASIVSSCVNHKRDYKPDEGRIYSPTNEIKFDELEYIRELQREIRQRDDVIDKLRQELQARKEDNIVHDNSELLTTVNHIIKIPEKTLMYVDKVPDTIPKSLVLSKTSFTDGSVATAKLFEYKVEE